MADEILKVIDELAKRMGIVIDWTSENVMPQVIDLYERFVTWQIAVNAVWAVIGIALVFGFVKCIKTIKKEKIEAVEKGKETTFYDKIGDFGYGSLGELAYCMVIGLALLAGLGVMLVISSAFDIIKLLTIPELYIIDYFDLLGGQK